MVRRLLQALVMFHISTTNFSEDYSNIGNSSWEMSNLIDLAIPGFLSINPARSRDIIIWCTVGGVTSKKRCISASAGARPFIFV